MSGQPQTPEGQRAIQRALAYMQNGKARSWSHALEMAGNTLRPNEPTTTTTKKAKR